MSEVTQSQRPWFFNLKANGDNAIVRLLHTNVSTIEKVTSHRAEVDGKKKRIRCIGDECPLCASGNNAEERIYVHLFDYTDNREKVWERTDKILPQLEELFKSWNPLSSAVIKITRVGDAFPKYTIDVQNPVNFAATDAALNDQAVAKMFSLNRKKEEIEEFIKTGKFPERKPFIPKDEYKKLKEEEKAAFKNETSAVAPSQSDSAMDDPFMSDPFVQPKRV